MEVCLLCTFTSKLCHASHSLTLLFALRNLLDDDFSDVGITMKVVIHLLLYEITYIFINGNTIWRHIQRAEFDLCLRLEHWFLHIHGNSGHKTGTNVAILKVLVRELLDSLCDMLLESTLVSSALSGMLTIHERMVLLTILVGMRKGNLNVLALDMNDRVEGIARHIVFQKILKSVA